VIDHFGKQTVLTTDLLIENVILTLYIHLLHLGYKSVVANLSDIYAMNATPTQLLISLGFSNWFSLEALTNFVKACMLPVTNMVSTWLAVTFLHHKKGFIISITAIGEVAPDKFVQRSTAKKGDLLCCSGDLGAAYLGLIFLEREKKIFLENPNVRPDLEGEKYVIGRILKPEAAKKAIGFFEQQEIIPTSMMDISDGLSSEILHICKQSNLGCVLYEEKIPISEETRNAAYKFQLDPTACALSGGEDYELLFTVRQEDFEKLVLNENISVIGYMTDPEEGKKILTKGGNKFDITAQGWNAFKK
jgi:thiamine-monophosphate kinase